MKPSLGARILRIISPQDEKLRMELREAAACAEANAEDLVRTMRSISSDAIQEMMRKVGETKK